MGTTIEKLNKVLESKNAVKRSIINKGVNVGNDFSKYASAIDSIQTGITPIGTLDITENGEHDVTVYAKVNVNVNNEAEEQMENVIIQLATLVDVVVSAPTVPTVPTDLNGYTVTVPAGWTATAGYGEFGVAFNLDADGFSYGQCFGVAIGYENDFSGDFPSKRKLSNSVAVMGGSGFYSIGPFYSNTELTFEFAYNYDITNQSLIQWFVDNNAVFEKATLISFTYNTTTYQCEEGMTWEEFINSEYNTNSFFVKWVFTGDPYVSYSGTTSRVIALNDTPVKLTDVISSNTYSSYYINVSGGGND